MEPELDAAVDAALDWLVAAQAPTGEMPAWATSLEEAQPSWARDSLQFITALVALALDPVDDPRARRVVDGAVAFLRQEREVGDQWRYWSLANPQHETTPPDADDTACASMAVACRGHGTEANVRLLMANRDPRGRFYTWLVPRRRLLDPRVGWALRDERRVEVRLLRDHLWTTTEAEADDVDAVVNANVCRYLAADAPIEAVEWVVGVVEAGDETEDKWHRRPTTMWASVGDGARRGVRRFADLAPTVATRARQRLDAQGTLGTALDTALALGALQAFSVETTLRREMAEGLVATQCGDGSWARSIFYFGGPMEVFGWSSEALTTACAVGALAAQ
ncbi:MAG: hypothetical protein ACR2JF_01280 [Iamia sp.]